ncbi:hypothetical protein BRE01_14360 [Brevibacillus reuszeri]|uniref:Uncharacterized protein n=1 Tax=Brevibacillus reuszeri TaxID=54915 RepID=A0A0K9Z0X9_9BACL|nr:hypothetical protein [Brevibacillus reuszeri]KNB74624.1 hypothetical protein ADS79_02775 [Brevibacillus reuszeri]MED1856567.1 hypothetical protein [Brevibacillus reuszeri]GED67734.1 hypothetical protein BRE01_14360 [Brevibacillus reuszeri]
MKNKSNFVSMITEMGFDINKPFDITGSGNENGLTLSLIIQGERENYWRSDLRLAAIKHLINSIDLKHDANGDHELFDKFMLTILDTIGRVIALDTPIDEKRNIEVVQKFIQYSLNSRIVLEAEKEGLIDQE